MTKHNGHNQNAAKSMMCKTPGCGCTANADTGYCFVCEIAWAQFGREVAAWIALRDAAIQQGWARPEK